MPNGVIDPMGGTEAPIDCGGGLLGANLASCDTNVVCPPDHYVDYGVCIPLPTVTVTENETTTTTTTTVTDPQGNPISQEDDTVTIIAPVPAPQPVEVVNPGFGGGSGSPPPQGVGDCDPTSVDYFDCSGITEQVGDNFIDQQSQETIGRGQNELNQLFDGMEASLESGTDFVFTHTFINAFNAVFPQPTSCQDWVYEVQGQSMAIECTQMAEFRGIFGWALYVLAGMHLFELAFRKRS